MFETIFIKRARISLFILFTVSILFSFFTQSCMEEKGPDIACTITERDIMPEGICFSARTNSFYITSMKKHKIIKVDRETGNESDFVLPDVLDMSFLGMTTVDEKGQLWACGNNTIDGTRYSTVSCFNLETGQPIKIYWHSDTIPSLFNDLAIDKLGNVFITNTFQKTVYYIDHKKDSLEIFYRGEEIDFPNGISLSPDGTILYVAANNSGIRMIDVGSREIAAGVDSISSSTGIDGLKYYKNSLIGIVNEVKTADEVRICRYRLDETGLKITSVDIIDKGNPVFDIPTTCDIYGNDLFCLSNSQMGNLDFATNEIRDPDALTDYYILRYGLSD